VTQLLKPPINYIIIAIVVGIMIVKQMTKKKNEKELSLEDSLDKNNSDGASSVNIPGLNKLEKDYEYSKNDKSKIFESESKEDSVKEKK
jgi:signal peptidase